MQRDLPQCFEYRWRARRDRGRLRIVNRALDCNRLLNVRNFHRQLDASFVGPVPAIDMRSVILERDIAGPSARQARNISSQSEFQCIDDPAFPRTVPPADCKIVACEIERKLAYAAELMHLNVQDLDHEVALSESSGSSAALSADSLSVSLSSNTGLRRAATSRSAA